MLEIAIAFFAILTPGLVVWAGIKWLANRREAALKAEQDREMVAHDLMLAGRARMSKPTPKQPPLRAVPRTQSRCEESFPRPITTAEPIYPGSVAANPFSYSMPIYDSTVPSPEPVTQYAGNGGTFDGGGASADWSCSPSSDSGSSDSGSSGGSCGSGD